MLMEVYDTLLKEHGRQNWWPCKTGNKFEICIGAILTQNTNWANAEKAIDNLIKAKCMAPKKIAEMDVRKLQSLIRSSGFFRQKARRLKEFSHFVLTFGSAKQFLKNVTRDELLNINGIGPETADSILLYACGKPFFVVDAYTKRMFTALGMVEGTMDYEGMRGFFEGKIIKDIALYREFHALIVKHSKTCCKGFVTEKCILRNL
ncbi:MAG: endonuclease [Candidatus Aenigmarchaeota archaeon]|nr:endonuclease [Candidatus Aenigmarchaeota archaeon]